MQIPFFSTNRTVGLFRLGHAKGITFLASRGSVEFEIQKSQLDIEASKSENAGKQKEGKGKNHELICFIFCVRIEHDCFFSLS